MSLSKCPKLKPNEVWIVAYNRGWSARLAGKPAADNPYRRGSGAHRSWLAGWEDQAT